jgi:hypothetical protein
VSLIDKEIEDTGCGYKISGWMRVSQGFKGSIETNFHTGLSMISDWDYETSSSAYENYLLNENHENSKLQKSNLKQIPMTQIQNPKQMILLQLCPTASSPADQGL